MGGWDLSTLEPFASVHVIAQGASEFWTRPSFHSWCSDFSVSGRAENIDSAIPFGWVKGTFIGQGFIQFPTFKA